MKSMSSQKLRRALLANAVFFAAAGLRFFFFHGRCYSYRSTS